jgi:hypothetical protein
MYFSVDDRGILELAEFALSWSLSANLQGGLATTMRDLFFGFAGSLLFGCCI